MRQGNSCHQYCLTYINRGSLYLELADDLVIMRRFKNELNKTIQNPTMPLDGKGFKRRMHLIVHINEKIVYKFEVVEHFTYLSSFIEC